jgi:hypothetical protein
MIAACIRCAEPLVDPSRGCGFCRGERLNEAVTQLVAAAKSSDNAALLARVDAIDTLRSLGFSSEQVVLARAQALDGRSVGQILEGLIDGARGLEAVA